MKYVKIETETGIATRTEELTADDMIACWTDLIMIVDVKTGTVCNNGKWSIIKS